MNSDHPIFRDNPLSGEVNLSTGTAPTPYHVYDGEGLMIFGDADFETINSMIAEEDVFPVKTASGGAAAGFIMANFEKASMGAHHELQFFVLVSTNENESLVDSPFALPLAMATQPNWGTLCVNLWNDVDTVIAFNNEYLGLNAQSGKFRLFQDKHDRVLDFHISDPSGGDVFQGRVATEKTTTVSVLWQMLRTAGVGQIIKLARAAYAGGHVINRKSAAIPTNRQAPIFTSADQNVSRLWDPDSDQLRIGESSLSTIKFVPVSLQHLKPFRFVYRHPDDNI